ncbi:MAG: glucose-1-phosphate adenylyltransferase [Actinomycetota bacterium]|nr:glucose-1-phosphate adenylyltransferase [Actinomycetota bacterium]
MSSTLALVLAGGEGQRLSPLTSERAKPAVHFGGRYRLVDFVLSNLVNSGLRQIRLLTQYRSTSLVQHVARNWALATHVADEYIETVPASMNIGPTWFRGTADAIWQNLDLLRESRPSDVFVFGADHIYKMDVSLMLDHHRAMGADVTVATVSVPRTEARAFGCVAVDGGGWVTSFQEKPEHPPGLPEDPDRTLVSMGNYIFREPALVAELRRNAKLEATTHDFGRDILSTAHQRFKVAAYDLNTQLPPGEAENARGYWRDVGTIDSYYEASMDLIAVEPRLNLYNPDWPIGGSGSGASPCKFVFADDDRNRVGTALDSIVGSGTIISGGQIERTVCSDGVRVNSYAQVEDSVLFPRVEVGRGARLRRCIVDKGVRIHPGDVIGEDPVRDAERFTVSENGVVVVTRTAYDQRDEYDL